MANSFLLLILPMRTFTIHLGSYGGQVGLSLRGSCCTPAEILHLDQAIKQSLDSHPTQLWVDCQQLHSLSWQGQRALVQADTRTRAAGTTLYWCGLAGTVLAQLASSGFHAVLNLLPAKEYEGPRFLLPAPTATPTLGW